MRVQRSQRSALCANLHGPRCRAAGIRRQHVCSWQHARACVGGWQIVIQEGLVNRWLFTGPSGHVMKKRNVDLNEVRATFPDLALSNPSNTAGFVAVARTPDGSVRLLDQEEFVAFGKQFETNVLTLQAVQAYIHANGGQGSVYRNTYSIVNDKGRILYSTYKLPGVFYKAAALGPDFSVAPVRSKEMRVNDLLASVTLTIVRYLETYSHVRVLNITLEYIMEQDTV